MDTMLACVKTAKGIGNVEVKRIAVPEPKADEVLIKVYMTGICGSDVKIYQDAHPYFPPVVLGHEIAGEITALGSDIANYNIGDRVVTDLNAEACGLCEWCRTGQEQICAKKKVPGYARDGGFAEYVSIPVKSIYRIPDNLSPDEAVFSEPLAVVVRGIIDRAEARPGDTALVSGCGTLGLLAVQVLKAIGAGTVILTGLARDAERLKMAKEQLGADYTINVQNENWLKDFANIPGCEKGVDLVVEVSGAKDGIRDTLSVLKRQGKFLAIGIPREQEISIPWPKLIFSAHTIIFSVSSNYSSWSKSLSLLASRKIITAPLLSKKYPLSDAVEGIKSVESGSVIKGVIVP